MISEDKLGSLRPYPTIYCARDSIFTCCFRPAETNNTSVLSLYGIFGGRHRWTTGMGTSSYPVARVLCYEMRRVFGESSLLDRTTPGVLLQRRH
jgi:hypothetical protein